MMDERKRQSIFDLNRNAGHGSLGLDLVEGRRTAAGHGGAPDVGMNNEQRRRMIEQGKENYLGRMVRRERR